MLVSKYILADLHCFHHQKDLITTKIKPPTPSQIIGAVNVGLVSWHFRSYYAANPQVFFLLMAVAFLIGTFCLLASCLVSLSTGGIISKTAYELFYHTVAFVLYLIASIILLVHITDYSYGSNYKNSHIAAAVRGLRDWALKSLKGLCLGSVK